MAQLSWAALVQDCCAQDGDPAEILAKDNSRHSQVLPCLVFQAPVRVSSLCLRVGLPGLVLAPQLEPGTEFHSILNQLRGKD